MRSAAEETCNGFRRRQQRARRTHSHTPPSPACCACRAGGAPAPPCRRGCVAARRRRRARRRRHRRRGRAPPARGERLARASARARAPRAPQLLLQRVHARAVLGCGRGVWFAERGGKPAHPRRAGRRARPRGRAAARRRRRAPMMTTGGVATGGVGRGGGGVRGVCGRGAGGARCRRASARTDLNQAQQGPRGAGHGVTGMLLRPRTVRKPGFAGIYVSREPRTAGSHPSERLKRPFEPSDMAGTGACVGWLHAHPDTQGGLPNTGDRRLTACVVPHTLV